MLKAVDLAKKHAELMLTDQGSWAEYVAEDLVWEWPCAGQLGIPTSVAGKQIILEMLKGLPYRDPVFENGVYYAVDDNTAFLEGSFSGSGYNGGPLEQVTCTLIKSENGKIKLIREYYDPLAIGKALKVDMNIGGLLAALAARGD